MYSIILISYIIVMMVFKLYKFSNFINMIVFKLCILTLSSYHYDYRRKASGSGSTVGKGDHPERPQNVLMETCL